MLILLPGPAQGAETPKTALLGVSGQVLVKSMLILPPGHSAFP